ncbi:MAG: pyridoxal phosphate-dependent aminotransferase [Thermoplasmatales archaeon]|nr:pyridoxal phosphate-dependent aminotransferase [Candidatus Thermoplasmatota archaeon]MDA8055518.1 pyridoxal phosphate-dependent aminotransferase [Thermoplasmatales archaeon]
MPMDISMFRYVESIPEDNINLASSAMKGMNPEGVGGVEIEEQIAKLYSVDKDQVIVTPSNTFGSFFTLHYLRKKISSMVTITPEYPAYHYQAREIGINTSMDNRISTEGVDLSPWDVDERTAYFISNPNNPTGLTWSDESLKSIARETEGNESYLVIDDTFSFFNGTFPKKLETGNSIILGSVSKFFGESGIKMGWIVAGRQIIEEMKERIGLMVPVISTSVKRRGNYLLSNIGVYKDYNKKKLDENSKILFESLDEYILGYRGSIINVISLGGDSTKFAFSLMADGVSTVPGYYFGSDSLLRIGIGTEDAERTDKGVKLIAKRLSNWKR